METKRGSQQAGGAPPHPSLSAGGVWLRAGWCGSVELVKCESSSDALKNRWGSWWLGPGGHKCS
jgi:hypothetical protein